MRRRCILCHKLKRQRGGAFEGNPPFPVEIIHRFTVENGPLTSMNLSPDGSNIITTSKSIRIYTTDTGEQQLNKNKVSTYATFSPDGKTVVSDTGGNGSVSLWNVSDGKKRTKIFDRPANMALFLPDGVSIMAAFDDGLRLLSDDRLVHMQSTDPIHHLSVSPDGQMIATSDGHSLRLWAIHDFTENEVVLPRRTIPSIGAYTVDFSPDNMNLVAAYNDRTVRVWNVQTGAIIHTLNGHSDMVNSAHFSPDGTRLVSASNDGTVRIWDATTGDALYVLRAHSPHFVVSARVLPNGYQLVSASNDGTVIVWEDRLWNAYKEDIKTRLSMDDIDIPLDVVNLVTEYL